MWDGTGTASAHGPGEVPELGAHSDGQGTRFSVFSRVAERVELCLLDDGRETRIDLRDVGGYTWTGYVPAVGAGQRYGFRVHGPWDPAAGLRCHPAKLLLDPYALAIEGTVDWVPAVFGHRLDDPDRPDEADSAPHVPHSVVIDRDFDWGDDRPPGRHPSDSVIYETHVKGFTMRHPGVPEAIRGTYAGMAHPAAIEHLTRLGVTAVELLPVHHFVHDGFLLERGLSNYWGYNSIGFFAPHAEYASTRSVLGQVREFKGLVKALHAAGIEVLVDVVYNHTAEGNEHGPTLSLRGLDNRAYYRLVDDAPRHYFDYTGTGNTLNLPDPQVLQMVMDSLRYWVSDMHVDGFRFDLAPALAREGHEVDRSSSFFDAVHQDPVLRRVKLIAEPWDVGEGGYQVGNFPVRWAEWNGRYRDTVRDLWRGVRGSLADFGSRFTGSPDLYADDGRRPFASVNLISAHDGFTLADLVSFDHKHNDSNGEEGRDGEDHNRSWNSGAEGPTDDAAVLALRARRQRSLLATLLLSQGMPMLLGGDEIGRSQGGNNNAYAQDGPISWYDWAAADESLLSFTERLVRLRLDHPVFRRGAWLRGAPEDPTGMPDIGWFRPDGREMEEGDWIGSANRLGILLSPAGLRDGADRPVTDDTFFVALNASGRGTRFRLPALDPGRRWRTVFDTGSDPTFPVRPPMHHGGMRVRVAPFAVALLRRDGR